MIESLIESVSVCAYDVQVNSQWHLEQLTHCRYFYKADWMINASTKDCFQKQLIRRGQDMYNPLGMSGTDDCTLPDLIHKIWRELTQLPTLELFIYSYDRIYKQLQTQWHNERVRTL
ncbi:hypothetical protein AVEN_17962-1 [Araneus ventricosus]|uniref:Uncharacterized protein n=1 Tax=Araneus ventricosus TaxID=182803 RepID=A0A4Y2KSY6_ARAVE|nr:hypothetical protein AVEN_17962-1 [Araneus ventricosus]